MPEKAYYYPAPHDLGMLGVRPSADGTKAIVDLGGRAGTLWFSDPADARDLMTAAFKAWRWLNPDGPLDALMSELLDEPDLAKIRARILEEERTVPPAASGSEHICSARRDDTNGGYWLCTAAEDHAGDHAAWGGAGMTRLYDTWPQDAAPDTAQPEDIPEPDDGTGCPECGAVGLPRKENGTCRNQEGCRERQAAKASAR